MRPFSYKGRAYQRVESATSTMPQEMYNQYLIQRGGKYAWEAITNPDLKISDLDEHAVISAVRGGIRSGRLPEATIREDLPTLLCTSPLKKAIRTGTNTASPPLACNRTCGLSASSR